MDKYNSIEHEAENILSALVEIHKYKNNFGKDAFYEERKNIMWQRAYKWLDELEKSWKLNSDNNEKQ